MENLKRVLNISPDLIDSAYDQNIITLNEFRMFLGLPYVQNGDILKNGNLLVLNNSESNESIEKN